MKKSVFFAIALLCAAASAQEQAPPAAGQEAPNAATVQEPPNAEPARLFDFGANQAPTPPVGAVQTPPPAGATPAPPPAIGIPTPPSDAGVQAPPEPEPAPAAVQAPPDAVVQQARKAAAAAQTLPRIAVYVTGTIGDNEGKALGTRMLSALVNSGRYRGIERSDAFLAEIEKEHVRQRSGDIDDSQISALGKQFGVKFVCIADITPAFGAYLVSARIVDVETAEVPFIGDASSPLKTMEDLEQVSIDIVRKMLYFAGESGGGKQAQQTIVVVQQQQQRQEQPLRNTDFTGGERWGTWALNIVPGLGSYVVMEDKMGAVTNAVIGGLGWTLIIMGASNSSSAMAVPGLMALGVSTSWNIYRSATYHHPNAERRPWKNRMSYGAGGFFANHFGGGVRWDNGEEVAMPYSGGGGYAYFDLIYAEIFAGYSGGGGKWESNSASNPDDLPDMRRTYINSGLLLKFPFGWERVKIFPLLGGEIESAISVKLVGNDKINAPNNFRHSVLWPKIGIGTDVALGKRAYVRAEALYGYSPIGSYGDWNVNYQGGTSTHYAKSRANDGLTLKAGFGMKIGKVQ